MVIFVVMGVCFDLESARKTESREELAKSGGKIPRYQVILSTGRQGKSKLKGVDRQSLHVLR